MSINTTTKPTWCPGCFNFQILGAFKNFIEREMKKGKTKKDFAIVTGIGCHAKLFDYVNLNGINGLHGRVLPTCLGLKIGNPNLEVYGFSGDGDAYSEGIEHLVHAPRYNANINYFVHNNQVFALTVGQPTPTSEKGFKDKSNPEGVKIDPLNPIKLMLSLNCGFVARIFADMKQIEWVLEEAKKYKGFKFIEILQPCLIFHNDKSYKEHTYLLDEKSYDKTDWNEAMKKAQEWDYNGIKENTKIPLGIFYENPRETFEEKFWQLKNLMDKKKSWKDIKR